MSNGLMESDTTFPSSSGIPMDGANMLPGYSQRPFIVAGSIGGTPGTGATYDFEVLIEDEDGATWKNLFTLSGNGAAATGQKTIQTAGKAVRCNADNGTTPGTGANTPYYVLNTYPVSQDMQVSTPSGQNQ